MKPEDKRRDRISPTFNDVVQREDTKADKVSLPTILNTEVRTKVAQVLRKLIHA